ncbi:MAG: ACP S-malonyltransferase, partial [Bdellovibrionaceae bacterium]|nr:ACP S-malonyltransferase [Pseudobdellovibrionaceae bacterium]
MAVLLFPGQGSQSPKMGEFLFENFSIAKETFAEASEALKIDMTKLCFQGTEAELALTENTQPALLCVSTASQRVLIKEFGINAEAAAGHSIGEYAALVAAGSVSFSDAMRAVRIRGQAMQSAVPLGQGGMMAVLGLDNDQVKWLCEWTEKNSKHTPISPANFNSPGQIVISGSSECLKWLKENFNAELIPGSPKRAKLIPLNVSAPFHCQMMNSAQEKMKEVLSAISFNKPTFPIIQNFNATFVSDPNTLRQNLISQVSAPVLWTQ